MPHALRFAALLALCSCASGPSYRVGQRKLAATSVLYDAPATQELSGLMVFIAATPEGCATLMKLDCGQLTQDVPPFDSLVLLLPSTQAGSYPIDPHGGAAALLGFHDEPGKRDVVGGKVDLSAAAIPEKSAPLAPLKGSFDLQTLLGDKLKGEFEAARCPGLFEKILSCQLRPVI